MGRSKGNTLGQPAPSVQVCCFRTHSYPFATFCVTGRVLLLMFSCFFFSFQKRRSVWLTVNLHGPIRCAMWTNVYLFLINNSGQQLHNWLLFLFNSPSVHFLGLVLRIGVLTEKRESHHSLKVTLVPAGLVFTSDQHCHHPSMAQRLVPHRDSFGGPLWKNVRLIFDEICNLYEVWKGIHFKNSMNVLGMLFQMVQILLFVK